MRKLLTLGPQELSSGMFSGVGKAAAPIWTGGENVVFRNLGVEKLQGARVLAGPFANPILAIAQASVEGLSRAYVGTGGGVYVAKQETGFLGELLQSWNAEVVDLETWGSWLLASNGLDPVKVWKNTGVMANLAGTTFTWAKLLYHYNPYMLAFNTSNGGTRVEWCSDDDVELWTPAANNTAGNFTLRDLDSEIVAAVPLGKQIAVYSRASMAIGNYIGPPNIFGFEPALEGLGAVSARSVVAQGSYNYGLTQNGIFQTDGNSFRYLDDPAMAGWLRAEVDWNYASTVWGMHDDVLREIVWQFRALDGELKSLHYHYDLQVFSRGRLGLQMGADRKVFRSPLVADKLNRLCLWQEDGALGDEPIEFFIETKPLDFGERGVNKILQMIRVDGKRLEGARMKIGALDQPEDTPTWFYDQPLDKKNYPDWEAPYFTVQFYGSSRFEITGVEFFGVPGGLAL